MSSTKPSMKVKKKKYRVKWNNKKILIQVSDSATGLDFKKAVFAKTGVPVERMTVFGIGGGELEDHWKLKSKKCKKVIRVIGTAEQQIEKPVDIPIFAEDINKEEVIDEYPCGLINKGNTCYLNSVVQSLNMIPELREYFIKYKGNNIVALALSDVFKGINDISKNEYDPSVFVDVFRQSFRQFSQQDPQTGYFLQQDSCEFMNVLLNSVMGKEESDKIFRGWKEIRFISMEKFIEEAERKKRRALGKPPKESDKMVDEDEKKEEEEEPLVQEEFKALNVNIQKETQHILYGLKKTLDSDVERQGRMFVKQARVCSLPDYLCVNYIRFFFKKLKKKNAKMVKRIRYEMILDVYNLCGEDLQGKISQRRKLLSGEESLLTEEEKNNREMISTYPAGYYELFALVTHQGRRADSGHYVGWVKMRDGKWMKYDDDKVSEVESEDDILKLCGGLSDHHIAYLAYYRRKTWEGEEIVHKALGSSGEK